MKKITGVLVIASLLFLPAISFGQLITIQIEAVVKTITDAHNLLEGKVAQNSIITGTYTYDTSTSDVDTSSDFGEYLHSTSPYGIIMHIGDLVFSTNFDNVAFSFAITNENNVFSDCYSVSSRNNLPLLGSIEVNNLYLQFNDYSKTALSNTDMPIMAPILSDWDSKVLVMGGGQGGTAPCYEKTFYIQAEVYSAVLIPEPISILLFGFGILALRKQK